MNAAVEDFPVPVIPPEEGFYAGRILIAGVPYAIIQPPKAMAEYPEPTVWIARNKSVPDALSLNDGLANTEAMARAGSTLGQWMLDHGLYLPSLDEGDLIYRAFKPTTDENSQWARSGINVSAIPPTYPYSLTVPGQTTNELFRAGGPEAFEPVAYWRSTQHAAGSGFAWYQDFDDGGQYYWGKYLKLRARGVRRIKL